MKQVLIINGYDPQPGANGELTQFLVNQYGKTFKEHDWQVSFSQSSHYEIETEQAKINKADLIVFQFPVYWYAVPANLKKYIDDVFTMDFAYEATLKYADGPLLTGKRFFCSTTWGAPASAFEQNEFLAGLTVKDLLLPIELTMKFCGIQQMIDPVNFFEVGALSEDDYQKKIASVIDQIEK
ncbi:NAD(P)H-dependent oxidoreductase [Paucilactobacillus sp. N302-9]